MEKYSLDKCRICNSEVKRFLDLGATHPPEEFRTKEELSKPIETFPLGLSYCVACGQVQLSHEIPPDVMYKQNYFYDYSITMQSNKHYTELSNLIMERFKPAKSDLIVDIGSNTGKLLWMFQNMGFTVQGIDPATKLVKIARENGIPTIDSYFGESAAQQVVNEKHTKAKVITCNNVFDHVTDLYAYMKGINVLLDPEGVFIVEDPYFLTFFQTLNHVVYHQQLDYLLVKPFSKLFDATGMELFDCEKIPYHGGSIRLFIGFKGKHKVSDNVKKFIQGEEKEILNNEPKALEQWAKEIIKQKDDLANMLHKLKAEGKSIAGVGMSAKGNVLLFYSGLGPETFDFITEQSDLKVGRYTPLGVPIVSESELVKRQPDYAVVLAWNFTDDIYRKFQDYKNAGGKFIMPIPKLKIVE